MGHCGSARALRQPRAPKARPYGLRGLTAQRGQASGYHANNAKKRLSGYPAAFSTGTRLKSRSPRSVTNFVSHTWGALQNVPDTWVTLSAFVLREV